MTEKDLRDHIEGLFSDTGLESEAEADTSALLAEEAIVDLLASEAEPDLAGEGEVAAEVQPRVVAQPAVTGRPSKTPRTGIGFWGIPLKEQRARILSILLNCVTTLGGVLLVFLLIRLIWREPMPWSRFQTLYFAAYMVAIVITLIQWMFNASLSKALREAEEKRDEAVRSQTIIRVQADELARANAPLQRRVFQLETALQIVQAVASILDPDKVLQRAVNLIRERFDLYHVGLFLIDRSGQWAVLRASTGEKEDQMRQPGYRVKVGDTSIVGWCTANAQLCTAPTPGATSIHGHQVTPTLSEIRSEMAIPLESYGHLIGALKVQSTEREAFPEEDVAVLQMVAQQVAIAIDNTQSLAEMRSRLQAVERRTRDYAPTERAYPISTQVALSYERTDHGGIHRASTTLPDELGELRAAVADALTNRQAVVQSDSSDGREEATLLTSIRLRDEALGVLGLHETDSGREWTDDEVALVEAVADQMALAIENARLLEETRGRAEREQLVGDITAKMQHANDMDMLMQNTIQELLTALNASHVAVHLGTKDQLLSRLGGDSSDQNE